MTPLRIAVVGCGVAGQAAALFLAESGHRVSVFERFPRALPVGAGLLLQPTGMAALRRLGLLDKALALGARVESIDARTTGGRRVLDLAYRDLHPRVFGLGIRRAALFGLLHAALRGRGVALHAGRAVAGLSQGDAGVEVAFDDGTSEGGFDLAVAADGAESGLRESSPLRRAAPVYPWACLWVTQRDDEGAWAGALRQRVRSATRMMGVLPVGRLDAEPAGARNVTVFWSLPTESWRGGEDFARRFAAWREEAARFWPEAAPLLRAVAGPQDVTFARYRDVGMRPWNDGRVVFVGDAAHGTSPQLGQGANLALLDAAALAAALEEAKPGDVPAALAAFHAARVRQVDFYRRVSRWLTPFYQSDSRALGALRDAVFGPLCRTPGVRGFMLSTMAGVRRGWLGVLPLDADGLPRLDRG